MSHPRHALCVIVSARESRTTCTRRRSARADTASATSRRCSPRRRRCAAATSSPGIAAESGEERVAAQFALADLPLTAFLNEAVVPYEADEVTRLIVDTHDKAAFAPVASLTVGGFRDWLLSDEATTETLTALAPGLTPEMAAAVSKICRLQDLMLIASKCSVVTQVPQHDRPARPALGAAAAQPSDRRPARHRRQHSRRPAARLGRRRDRHQPGDRQPGARSQAARHARRRAHQARYSDPELRARACDDDARADQAGRAGRSGVPVGRRHRGGEQGLRRQPRAAARRRAKRRLRSSAARSATT